jgi:endonuclease/exonuclease/phosphatase (EEP) superfamily protein YafD
MLAAPLATLLFALAKRWVPTAVATLLTIASVAIQLPLLVAEGAHAAGMQIRVMTANVYLGQADAASVVATASANADVLAVQELTPEEADRMGSAGLNKVFPYRELDARGHASGVGLWSRYPIVESHHIGGFNLAMVSARLRIEGVTVDPTVVVAHLAGPWPQPIDDWESDLQRMQGAMQQVSDANGGGCTIIAGDFNSTYDMRPFRSMLGDDFRDATEQAGAGWTLTFPANSKWPPFMGIDHVLTSRCTATSSATAALPGSDHRGLITSIDVPTAPVR